MPLKSLNLQSKLAKSPSNAPLYPIPVKNSKGEDVICGDPKATRALLALMNLGAVNGGAACHWGGPSAAAELMSAIHGYMFYEGTSEWYQQFNFVNDIGHAENGIYALRANLGFDGLELSDLKGFRSIESKLTGHGESHCNPEGVLLSNGPLSSSLAQAQGLAMADKILGRDRITINVISDGACMEGEAKEALAAIPGLAAKGKMNPFVLVISDNNTKLSGRIDDDSFTMQPSFKSLDALGWRVIQLEEGHNINCVYSSFEQAVQDAKLNPEKPVCLLVKTIKGYGVKSTEQSASGGHGFPIKAYDQAIKSFIDELWGCGLPEELATWADELTKKPETSEGSSPTVKKEKAQAGFSRAAIKAVAEGLPVYSVSCDLAGSTGMGAFQKECPENFVDVGIAESNCVSVGAGMSKAGLIPIVDTFSAFGVTKGNLPLIMASLSQAPVIAVFSHAGFQDAADGASHQSLTYLSAVSSIPNTEVYVVSCSTQAEQLLTKAIKQMAADREAGKDGKSYIFFVGRENFPVEYKAGHHYELGEHALLREGDDGVIVAAGPMVPKALAAAEELANDGKQVAVIDQSCINEIDIDFYKSLKFSQLITIEDHQKKAGMGAQLIHALKDAGLEFKSKTLGVDGEFGRSAYLADQLYAHCGLDQSDIVKAFKS